jgi:hypothetical protein
VRELSLSEVQSFLSRAAPTGSRLASSAAAAVPTATAALEAAAQRVAAELNPEELAVVLHESVGGSVPPQVDRRLLLAASEALDGAPLTPEQKRRARSAFLDLCRKVEK